MKIVTLSLFTYPTKDFVTFSIFLEMCCSPGPPHPICRMSQNLHIFFLKSSLINQNVLFLIVTIKMCHHCFVQFEEWNISKAIVVRRRCHKKLSKSDLNFVHTIIRVANFWQKWGIQFLASKLKVRYVRNNF